MHKHHDLDRAEHICVGKLISAAVSELVEYALDGASNIS